MCTISPENKPPKEETPKELSPKVKSPEEKNGTWNFKISIYYTGEILDRNKFVVDNIFALNITRSNDGEFEPQTVKKCWRRKDWPMWNSNRAKLMSKIWNIWTCSPYTKWCNACLNSCGYLYYEVQSMTYVIRFLAEI